MSYRRGNKGDIISWGDNATSSITHAKYSALNPQIEEQFEGISEETYSVMPPSVGWMFLQPCNFSCNFCFARFEDLEGMYLKKEENLKLTTLLSEKFEKITFLGGEPTLAPYLPEMLRISKDHGRTTSIITNGYRLNEKYLSSLVGLLDWVTISMDSGSEETHRRLGRGFHNGEKPLSREHYLKAAELVRKLGMRLKISTVVTSLNKDEDMTEIILAMKPERWKLFQCLFIKGENDGRVEDLLVSREEFQSFVSRHLPLSQQEGHSIHMYASTEDTKMGYACITPAGCFLDDLENTHRYSRPILDVGVVEAWKDISYRPDAFRARGGYYDWKNCSNSDTTNDIEDFGKETKTTKANQITKPKKKTTNNSKKTFSNHCDSEPDIFMVFDFY